MRVLSLCWSTGARSTGLSGMPSGSSYNEPRRGQADGGHSRAASAVWGAYAMNGVVNIVTKPPREMLGTTFMLASEHLIVRGRGRKQPRLANT